MWGLIIEGAIIVGGFIYAEWTKNNQPPKTNLSAKVPRVDDGAPAPLLYGRCRVRSPLLAWASPTTVVTGVLTPPQNVFTLDMLFIVGIPFFGGTATLETDTAGGTGLIYYGDVRQDLRAIFPRSIGSPEMYIAGPEPRDFGGFVEFWTGTGSQVITNGVDGGAYRSFIEVRQRRANISATVIPSYRNLALAFLFRTATVSTEETDDEGYNFSYDPVIPSISFEIRALSTGSAADMGRSLADEADPAAVIYDLLTSPWGKLGFPTDRVDLASFQAASLTLFNEQHGFSMAIDQETDAIEIVVDILRQVNGILYDDPITGKLTLKLARNDYGDPSVLQNINPDNAKPAGSGWYQVQAWSETYNQVRVTFTDRTLDYANGLAIAQDGANMVSQGGRLRSIDVQYPGCCTRDLAQRLASRDLAAASVPLCKASVVVNRSFYMARPGSVYTLTWPQLGIANMVMRVATVNLGQLHKGDITLELVRDIFDQSLGAFPLQ